MKPIFSTFVLAFICLLVSPHASAQSIQPVKKYEVEDFFKNPEKSSYQISPDGKHFSFMAPYESRMNVFVKLADGSGEATRITDVTDRDIAGYTWANDSRILYLKDNGGDENFAVYGVDLDGENYKALTAFDDVRTQFIDDLENDNNHILVGLNKRVPQVFDPYRLNIVTGELVMLAENPGNISGWMTDHDGKLRMAFTTDGVNNSILYRDTEESEWETLMTTNFKESMSPMFFTFDNKDLYAASNIGRDKNALIKYDISERKEVEVLYEHDEVDVSSLSYSQKRKVLTTISYTTDKRHWVYLDKQVEDRYNKLTELLPGYELALTGMNKAEDTFIIRTYSDRSLGAYYMYSDITGKLNKIEDVSPWLNEDDLCEMQSIKYTSRDGLTINGYLTLPKGKEAKNLPVVINPHGGPWARDNWGFNPEVQFLANRGYAVLQMNFRGSTGYGREFFESSFKQWGLTMQDDISDGVEWLINEGIADAERVAIYGGSYGGYATLAGLAFSPDLYACGVDYVGVSNLFTFMETIPPYWEPFLDMMYEMVGNPVEDKELMTAASPVFHADKIVAPLLVAQGAKDPRVNIDESDQMVAAMKERGVDVHYIVEPEEGHGFHNEENRFKFYRAMDTFLNQHIGDSSREKIKD
ncbi:MAG: dipeptidyl aminopeptidase/acylaminoacyl peptidase [Flavobacteriales bacterium]|jgi:dipeptidyl aminopeptidase/acylaminoacyl peptidase